jgi:hypothetical protein
MSKRTTGPKEDREAKRKRIQANLDAQHKLKVRTGHCIAVVCSKTFTSFFFSFLLQTFTLPIIGVVFAVIFLLIFIFSQVS